MSTSTRHQQDILRIAEELRSGNIHQSAVRYFSGHMSGAESDAFDLVMHTYPEIEEEVRLQGLALRAARVAGRTEVREKLDHAADRARVRASHRQRARLGKVLLRLAIPAVAAALVMAVLTGNGITGQPPRPVHYADVDIFSLLHLPNSADCVTQARLYRIPRTQAGLVVVLDSYRIGLVPLQSKGGLGWTVEERKVDALLAAGRDQGLRHNLYRAMRDRGLPVKDPIRIQKERLESEQESLWAGRVLNYPLYPGSISEEDPVLDISSATQSVAISAGPGSEAESSDNWHLPLEVFNAIEHLGI